MELIVSTVALALAEGGSDLVLRHNDVQGIIYGYAKRALQPQLETAGLLQDPGIF